MAYHKSARKRARQALRRRARNRYARGRMKTAVKNARDAVAAGDPGPAEEAVRTAESLIRRAASKRVIPKKRASRQVSKLARSRSRLGS